MQAWGIPQPMGRGHPARQCRRAPRSSRLFDRGRRFRSCPDVRSRRVRGVLAWLDFGSRPFVPHGGYSMDWQTGCVAKGERAGRTVGRANRLSASLRGGVSGTEAGVGPPPRRAGRHWFAGTHVGAQSCAIVSARRRPSTGVWGPSARAGLAEHAEPLSAARCGGLPPPIKPTGWPCRGSRPRGCPYQHQRMRTRYLMVVLPLAGTLTSKVKVRASFFLWG